MAGNFTRAAEMINQPVAAGQPDPAPEAWVIGLMGATTPCMCCT